MKRFVSVGECMIEMSGGADGDYRLGFAGDTLNTAWYARAALDDDWEVAYFTALGDDIYSSQMAEFLAANGIDTGRIRRIEGKRPGLYLIHQAQGDRHFTYWRENSAARQLADDPVSLAEAIGGAETVYFSGITLAILTPEARERLLTAIGAARRAGATTAFDPNIRPVLWPDTDELRAAVSAAAAVATFVLPTHDDEKPVFGDRTPQDTAERYLSLGTEEVVVKNGAEPALIATGRGTVTVPAEKGEVVDATGAGDSFNGAYLATRLAGADAETAGRKAHRTAARVIGHPGALLPRDQLA